MALNSTAKLHSQIFRTLKNAGGQTRWVKGFTLVAEMPRTLWQFSERDILNHTRHLADNYITWWGWRVISKRGPGGGYRLERAE